MPTSSTRLAHAALGVFDELGIGYALIHGADRLAAGMISDVDTVVDRPWFDVVGAAWRHWTDVGAVPVVVWPYDIGGTATVFLTTPDARHGVQLDLLHDPGGVGQLWVRSTALLESASVMDSLPVVSTEASLIYLWHKRLYKGQRDRLSALQDRAAQMDRQVLVDMSHALTGSGRSGFELLGLRREPRFWYADKRYPVTRLRRIKSRLQSQIGFWAHVDEEELAFDLVDRLSNTLVYAEAGRVPAVATQAPWYVTQVFPVIVRPGIFVSFGERPRWQRPHTILDESQPDEAAVRLIATMSARSLLTVSELGR